MGSDSDKRKLEAEFHALRHLLPLGLTEVDTRMLQVNINAIFGNKGFNFENFRIIRARTVITERGPRGEVEQKEAYYASLISLPPSDESGIAVLLSGPTCVAARQPEQPKKGGSWISSSVGRYADSPEYAKRSAIVGLVEVIEERMHEVILMVEKEPKWMKDIRAANEKSVRAGGGLVSASGVLL